MALAVERENTAPRSAPRRRRAPEHERFSESRLWAQQRAYYAEKGIEAWRRGEVPHYITSTAGAADIYAGLIVRYWRAALAAGDLDLEKPLHVLELGAGCGRFTYLLLKALRDKLVHAGPFRLRYVASDIVAGNLDFIAAHPYLAPEVEAGRLDTALWDAEAGGALRLRAQGLRIDTADNPMVVVANYVFDSLRNDLFGFHYGELFEGRVAVRDEALDYQWQPIAEADWLAPSWRRQVARYAERLDSGSLFFPSGALRCLDHVGELAPAGSLLLSADKGLYTEQQLRFCGAPDVAFHGSFSLPVNYHALSDCLQEQGARTWNSRHREDGLVYHVALRAAQPERYEECFAEVAARLEELNPDDHFTLKKAMEVAAERLAPEQLLALLRLGRHDYRVLGLMIEPMLAQAAALGAESRRLWREALERVWENYFPFGEDDNFHSRLGFLAVELGHWGLAKQAFRLGLWLPGDHVAALYQLALCEASTGQAAQALAWIEQAIELEPDNGDCRALHERLRERLLAPGKAAWRRAEDSAELTLEPLEIDHAASLLRQYRDPQIGVMARLPGLGTLEEAVEWIVAQRGEPGRITCAVMHRTRGFVGVVSLHCQGEAAYFYFWTGTDHQGAGYGRRAAALLFELARANGLRELFTSAYPDNARSRRALEALGFRGLPARAEAPDDELLFFQLPLSADEAPQDRAVERLQALCAAIDSPLKLRVTHLQGEKDGLGIETAEASQHDRREHAQHPDPAPGSARDD